MPPSPSDNRGRWKRRRRGGLSARKLKQEEEDVEEDEEDNNNDEEADLDDDAQQNGGATTDPGPSEVLVEGGVRISDFPAVIRRGVSRCHSSVTTLVSAERLSSSGASKGQHRSMPSLENISHGQLQVLSAMPADSAIFDPARSEGSGGGSCVIASPAIMEGQGVVKLFGSRVHVVPMHSDWFSPDSVNRLERQVVPHFFSGKSPDHTPQQYMECRNCIVAKYMDNPDKRLKVSDCLGLVNGVSNEDLSRIVRFLDHWGIINYCAVGGGCEPSNNQSYLREDPNGEVYVPSAALKSIESLIKFDKPKCRLKAADVYSSLPYNDDLADLDDRIRERLCDNHCNCCSQPLPTTYYQSQKDGEMLLCSDCFHDGRFVAGHSSIDFVKVDSTKEYDADGENWSDQETLLLLEAMELFGENWNEIADHVRTKSKAQCILHFVRLPMESGSLENIKLPSTAGTSKSSNSSKRDNDGASHSNGDLPGSRIQEADSETKLPFANSANPVMALVAFLASAVGPRIAAACAHASLTALSEDSGLTAPGREKSGQINRVTSEGAHSKEGNFHGENQLKENSTMYGSSSQNGMAVAELAAEKVNAAARVGLSAAATKAKLFADHEEREIQRLSANIINHQLKRLELKLKQFAEVETLLMKECEQVEKARQRYGADRSRLLATRFGQAPNLAGIAPSMVGNNRQQVMGASSSQPGISGYGNNQSVHPQMQFVPRPSMFPMGPRLPMNSIQTNSASPSNAMFNAPGNNQSSLNHQMVRSMSGTSSGLG